MSLQKIVRACLCLGPEVWVVGAVHDVEYGGHLDAGRGAHLLKQRLQVEPPAYIFGLDFSFIFIFGAKITQFERLLLCVPEVDLSHGPRIESVQEVVVRSF